MRLQHAAPILGNRADLLRAAEMQRASRFLAELPRTRWHQAGVLQPLISGLGAFGWQMENWSSLADNLGNQINLLWSSEVHLRTALAKRWNEILAERSLKQQRKGKEYILDAVPARRTLRKATLQGKRQLIRFLFWDGGNEVETGRCRGEVLCLLRRNRHLGSQVQKLLERGIR